MDIITLEKQLMKATEKMWQEIRKYSGTDSQEMCQWRTGKMEAYEQVLEYIYEEREEIEKW